LECAAAASIVTKKKDESVLKSINTCYPKTTQLASRRQ